MKKMILLSWVVLMIAPVAWTQDKLEAPVWNVGDKWILREPDGRTLTNEVVDVKDDLFIVKTLSGEGVSNLLAYDKKTINMKFTILQDGRKTINTDDERKLRDFPLFVGKKWTDTAYRKFTGGSAGYTRFITEFKIEGIEEVTTPAGTFKAYKILRMHTHPESHQSGWMRYWYSPDVKWFIKREVENSPFWPTGNRNRELISYELK